MTQTSAMVVRRIPTLPPCRVDEATGDVEEFVDFRRIANDPQRPAIGPDLRSSFDPARLELDAEVLDPDSHFLVKTARVLRHARVQRGQSGLNSAPAPVAIYVSARRVIQGGYRVDGPGSRATLVIGTDGSDRGYSRSWKKATRLRELVTPNPETVRTAIEGQLRATQPRGAVHVQHVELAYYDSGRNLLQPVYRYVAEFKRDAGTLGASEHLVGYVAFTATEEPLPELGTSTWPKIAPLLSGNGAANGTSATSSEQIKIGLYVARDNHKGWINDATSFWSSLVARPPHRFVSEHFLPAEVEHFTTRSREFVDSVDIALVEAHGAPLMFATECNCCDPVIIGGESFPKSGYGAAGGGRLKHWILHSCQVVLGPNEISEWAEAWRRVFQNGLYSVLGYRTPMYITDGVGGALGRRLAEGEPVLSAWFAAVASANIYGLNPTAKFHCAGDVDMGRPSAISACGSETARAGETVSVTPDCLDAWWIDDEDVELSDSWTN